MSVLLEEPLSHLDAVPGLYGVDGGPMTRQEILLSSIDHEPIATLDKRSALDLANRLIMLADQIQPGTTGWTIDGSDGWRRTLRRLAVVDDEFRERD